MLKGPELLHDANDDEECEYLLPVKWIKHVSQDEAKFRSKAGLFVTKLIVASMASQPKTLEFLEQQFKISFEKLLSVE